MNVKASIQELYWPDGICFGCGPANDKGLRIRSFPQGDEVVCEWQPEPHHQAFPDILNGGIIGTLLDCHSAATSHWALSEGGTNDPGRLLTARYAVTLLRPTPVDAPVKIFGRAVDVVGRKVTVESRIEAGGEVTATCEGLFVVPKPR
jgi:acyl-coenzyme A thioesterase PaaI-like protein